MPLIEGLGLGIALVGLVCVPVSLLVWIIFRRSVLAATLGFLLSLPAVLVLLSLAMYLSGAGRFSDRSSPAGEIRSDFVERRLAWELKFERLAAVARENPLDTNAELDRLEHLERGFEFQTRTANSFAQLAWLRTVIHYTRSRAFVDREIDFDERQGVYFATDHEWPEDVAATLDEIQQTIARYEAHRQSIIESAAVLQEELERPVLRPHAPELLAAHHAFVEESTAACDEAIAALELAARFQRELLRTWEQWWLCDDCAQVHFNTQIISAARIDDLNGLSHRYSERYRPAVLRLLRAPADFDDSFREWLHGWSRSGDGAGEPPAGPSPSVGQGGS